MTPAPDPDRDAAQFSIGTSVIDREAAEDDADQAVIVRVPAVPCREWEIEETGQTVADYNPDYPADAPVVIVVFEPALHTVDAWQHHEPADLWSLVQEHNLQTYAYPEPRLDPVGDALAEAPGEPLTVWFDGACEPVNPGGHGTYGIVIEQGGELVHEEGGYLGDGEAMTNNVAEYEALLAALTYVQEDAPAGPVTVHGDSELVIRQLTGEYAVRSDRLRPLWREAKQLATTLDVDFEWVPRDQNERADALAQKAYYEHTAADAIAQRRARAETEAMSITPIDDDIYEVKRTYRVDLAARSCTCPDFQNRGLPCKHIFKVEQEYGTRS